MGEFEDKLNGILSSPKDMEKILGLARELSGSQGGGEKSTDAKNNEEASLGGLGSVLNSFGDIDPKIFKIVSRLAGEYSSSKNDKTALVSSIKPYLRPERCTKLDQAVKIAKIAHIAKIALSEFSGGEFNI